MELLKKYLNRYRIITLCWCLFIGIGAVFGSMMFFLRPNDGFIMKDLLIIMRERLPFGNLLFHNFIFSGIALLIVNGITNLLASYYLIKKNPRGYFLGMLFGIILMLWISIQFYCFLPGIYLIDILYFLFGLLQFIFGLLAYITNKQIQFTFNIEDYPNIQNKSDEIVVYFSRMGYTKKVAYQIANERKAQIIELIPQEKIKGITGFWWCGRFAMHKWKMAYRDVQIEFSKFRKIYLVTPIWAFHIAAPSRAFIINEKNNLNSVHITFVHFMNKCPKSALKEVKNILNDRLINIDGYRSHFGQISKALDKLTK